MWLLNVFPNAASAEDAAIEDVGFLVLEQIRKQERGSSCNIGNLVRGLQNPNYFNPMAQPQQLPPMEYERIKHVALEAVAWLESEGLIMRDYTEHSSDQYIVTRRGKSIASPGDLSSYAKRAYLPREVLQDSIADVSIPPFLAGRYDEAVRAAFTRLEVTIRDASGYGHDHYGVAMVREAFEPGSRDGKGAGPLADPGLEMAERQAVAHLFAGAMGYIKNPLSHRELNIDDARLAASRILLANDLMYTLAAHLENRKSRAIS